MGVVVVAGAPTGRAQMGWIVGVGQRPPQFIYREQVGYLFDRGMSRPLVVGAGAIQQHIALFLELFLDVLAAGRLPEIHGSSVAVDVEAVMVFDASAVCLNRLESR